MNRRPDDYGTQITVTDAAVTAPSFPRFETTGFS